MVGENKAIDPRRFFVVTFALFSNGESSSPSNTPEPYNGPYFPRVSYEDNVRAQYTVLTQELNIAEVFAVIGFSMGGQQAYYWPVMYPDLVKKFIPICGSARTSPHNQCFLEGPKAALLASKDFNGGHYMSKPQHGIRAFGRVYSAWAYGQAWFRERGYLYDGKYTDLNDFLRSDWEGGFLEEWDANDLLTLLDTWYTGDISAVSTLDSSLRGDLVGALRTITAKGLIMPCKTDLYFPPEDSEAEVGAMGAQVAQLVVIPSVWGHMAGGGSNDKDDQFIFQHIQEFLGS
ncbi:hypothetical protein PHLGIDRAFT_19307 [Phlebiopsis gigantea 11061_1 CR5-6]|uniref:AB hydrolase-1 domain-containing protein n=1 Tax=Phlebiopsis gigantea (strain 11061_1 CR5-6) TaxID=745531 RepID=A0A0C3S7V2_PHLG1|nr:hypothetical protein PHLGIDRAFT_19307 [Phlebiopsis gigantea 11061_1 CR5-6]